MAEKTYEVIKRTEYENRGGAPVYIDTGEVLRESGSKNKVMKALSEFLRPEFLGRVDEVVVFSPLSPETLSRIAALVLGEYKTSLAERGCMLSWTDAALLLLADKAEGARYGARQLRRAIRREVEDPLAQWVTEGELPAAVTVDAKDGEIVLEKS